MKPKTYNIEIEITRENKIILSGMVDSDREGNQLQIKLKNCGDRYPLKNVTARMVYLRPDKEIIIQEDSITTTNDVINCNISPEALVSPGKVQTELQLYSGAGRRVTVTGPDLFVRRAL
jgi:hypothetical protein